MGGTRNLLFQKDAIGAQSCGACLGPPGPVNLRVFFFDLSYRQVCPEQQAQVWGNNVHAGLQLHAVTSEASFGGFTPDSWKWCLTCARRASHLYLAPYKVN